MQRYNILSTLELRLIFYTTGHFYKLHDFGAKYSAPDNAHLPPQFSNWSHL